jgi:hypothetical protein
MTYCYLVSSSNAGSTWSPNNLADLNIFLTYRNITRASNTLISSSNAGSTWSPNNLADLNISIQSRQANLVECMFQYVKNKIGCLITSSDAGKSWNKSILSDLSIYFEVMTFKRYFEPLRSLLPRRLITVQ